MAIDTQKFMDLTLYLNMLWSSPLQIALAMYFLWGILGPSSFSGVKMQMKAENASKIRLDSTVPNDLHAVQLFSFSTLQNSVGKVSAKSVLLLQFETIARKHIDGSRWYKTVLNHLFYKTD